MYKTGGDRKMTVYVDAREMMSILQDMWYDIRSTNKYHRIVSNPITSKKVNWKLPHYKVKSEEQDGIQLNKMKEQDTMKQQSDMKRLQLSERV